MAYSEKFDANGLTVNEGIDEIVDREVNVPATTTLTDVAVNVPSNSFGVCIKRLPLDAKIKINGQENGFIVDEADYFSPFVDGIISLTITTTSTSLDSEKIILQFIR